MEKVTATENNIYEDRNENEIEIDILELLFVFKKKAWVSILAALAGCLGSGYIQQKIFKTSVYVHLHGVCTVKGDNFDLPGRSADRKPAHKGLQCNDHQQAGFGTGD